MDFFRTHKEEHLFEMKKTPQDHYDLEIPVNTNGKNWIVVS
jgi:hypothetical protein